MSELHYAARDGERYRRACNRRRRMRLPNEDTDTALSGDVSCIRCRRTRAWQDASKGNSSATLES